MDKNNIALAGEFYVRAQLAQRAFVGTLTLGHTKGIDILVSDSSFKTPFRVEVKTTQKKPHREYRFGKSKFYRWPMLEKHESIRDDRLLYCFVCLGAPDELPKFMIVPSKQVASYDRRQHKQWLACRSAKVRAALMRRFRIPVNDPNGYQDNWKAFGKSSSKAVVAEGSRLYFAPMKSIMQGDRRKLAGKHAYG